MSAHGKFLNVLNMMWISFMGLCEVFKLPINMYQASDNFLWIFATQLVELWSIPCKSDAFPSPC